ncbi:hypothetical protein CFRS1_v008164 [Colletotrichum fructicola]|nr:hypothetical protein CFRS1_v008164 [Colletotrichum fructicola]
MLNLNFNLDIKHTDTALPKDNQQCKETTSTLSPSPIPPLLGSLPHHRNLDPRLQEYQLLLSRHSIETPSSRGS